MELQHFFFRKPGFAEISNYLIQPTIMRWWDAILAVINSDETGPCISMSEAGDYEKKSCLGSAKGLFVNKSMAPCISPSSPLLLTFCPNHLMCYQHCLYPPQWLLIFTAVCFLITLTLNTWTPHQCCIEMTLTMFSNLHYESKLPLVLLQLNRCPIPHRIRKWELLYAGAHELCYIILQVKTSHVLQVQQHC